MATQRRIHLASPGGGAACGAHNWDARACESDVLASHILALVDCLKCARTDQYRELVNPSRQYKLRLFAMVKDTAPPRRFRVADIEESPAFHRAEVLLDGEPQRGVVAYDADGGWLERYKRDERGKYVVQGTRFATERVTGAIEVRWQQAAA